jgi:hypothetical protein
MSRQLLITEQEKSEILKMYGLISEAIDPNTGGTIRIDNYYKPGWYSLDATDTKTGKTIKDQLNQGLLEARNFVIKHPNSIVSVKFVSQESAIPNKDNEGKEGGDFMDVNGLSKLRKKYLEPYIREYFDSLKTQGVINSSVQVPPLQYEELNPVTPWVDTPFCSKNSTIQQQRSICVQKYRQGIKDGNAEILGYKAKYDGEQKSYIEITVKIAPSVTTTSTTKPPSDCLTDMEITVWVPRHRCQNAEFFFFANNTLLFNTEGGNTTNLNNSDTKRKVGGVMLTPEQLNPGYGYLYTQKYGTDGNVGGQRYDTFRVTAEQSKQITSEGQGYLSLWMVATTGEDAHDDIPQVQVKLGGKEIYNNKPAKAAGQLLVFNECATEIYTDPAKMPKTNKPDATSLISELVNSRMKINPSVPVKANEDYKASILEASRNVNGIVDQIINSIQSQVTIQKAKKYIATPEFRRYLTSTYRDIFGILTQYRLLKDGGDYKFDEGNTSKGKKGDMYGDMRKRMDEFYNKFASIYQDSQDTWLIKGAPTMEIIDNLNNKGFTSLT